MRAAPLLTLLLVACSGTRDRVPLGAPVWARADQLFQDDPAWRGGDAAYSVALDEHRTLWLFGDSFINLARTGRRTGSRMVNNSIAIQTGRAPETSTLTFHWGAATSASEPESFFEGEESSWKWPLHGARVDDALVLFFMNVQRTSEGGPFGFEVRGSTAYRIENPDDTPASWRGSWLPMPDTPFSAVVGASVLADEEWLFAYVVREPGNHDVFLLRWALDDVRRGRLTSPQWWTQKGWDAATEATPLCVFSDGQTEFSVVRHGDGFVQVQSYGFGAAEIGLRRAGRPEGPWSAPVMAHRPQESEHSELLVYSAKAHPQLDCDGLVVTYNSNAWDFGVLVRSEAIYWPRFVCIPVD